ncbi:MAG: hypothetical protein WDZ50_08220 [Woeseia sp.]
MILRLLPLVVGLLPLVTVFTCYWIAIHYAGLPSCNPFLDGCTSISATGRYPPANFLFRAAMLPQSILLAAYWLLCLAWFRTLRRSLKHDAKSGAAIAWFGVIGALCLIPYVTFLGTQEPFYEFMRRYGVYLYFLLNVIAQVILAVRILPVARKLRMQRLLRLTQIQLTLSWIPFALGALNLILKATLDDSDPAENRIEWIFALLMQSYFVISYFSWRETGFMASYSVALNGYTNDRKR